MSNPSPATPTAGRPGLVLGICGVSVLLDGMDMTIDNAAVPAISRDLEADLAGLRWVGKNRPAYLPVAPTTSAFITSPRLASLAGASLPPNDTTQRRGPDPSATAAHRLPYSGR